MTKLLDNFEFEDISTDDDNFTELDDRIRDDEDFTLPELDENLTMLELEIDDEEEKNEEEDDDATIEELKADDDKDIALE